MRLTERLRKNLKDLFIPKQHLYLDEVEDSEKELEKYWVPEDRQLHYMRKKEDKYDVSVIIPVYNTEKYLDECLKSVLNQNMSGTMQIIVIDDGSTDKSPDILNRYESYPFPVGGMELKVVHKENGGLSSARNAGLELAEGRYVFFLDSDDILTSDCIRKCVVAAKANDADFVQVQYARKMGDKLKKLDSIRTGTYMEYSDMCQIPGFATMKLFRRELFDHIDFPEDYWFEDTIIHLNVFPKCKKGVVISETGYIYHQNDSGITQTRDGQARSLETVQVISKLKLKENYPEGYMDEILCHFGKLSYDRIKYLPEQTIKATFLLMCKIVETIDQKPSDNYADFYEAFLKLDYGIWKWYCTKKY